ncbi:MAG: DUF4214 domain-containing protein [Myxococcota bacterium]|nr:DUF4214 domain-containing protein [Myxococcota bacterium]
MRLTAHTCLQGLLWVALTAACEPQLGDDPLGPPPTQLGEETLPWARFAGRIVRDGRAFVSKADGVHFLWRGVAEFLLPWYLTDPSRSVAEREALVAGRIALRRRQGYTVLQVLGMLDRTEQGVPVRLRPQDDPARHEAALRRLLELARERGMYVEWILLADVGKAIARDEVTAYLDRAATIAQAFDNTFVEVAYQGWKDGLSEEEIYQLGGRFKQRAPDVLLAGTAAQDGGGTYGRPPFDYIVMRGEPGDQGWHWVGLLREGERVGAQTNRPVVQQGPMAGAGQPDSAQLEDMAHLVRAAALSCHATRQYFTVYHRCALVPSASPSCADVPTPGVEQVQRSDLISGDPRDGHLVDGEAADSPLDGTAALRSGALLRLYTKVLSDGSGFFSYPLRVTRPTTLPLRAERTIVVLESASGRVLSSRLYAEGEALPLEAGRDVVLVGGRAKAPPPPPPPPEPVPPQQPAVDAMVRTYTQAQATTIVHRLYQGFFGRDADPSGLSSYTPLVADGRLPRVCSILVQSAEFEARRPGLSVPGLSEALYRAILGRAPDPEGHAFTMAAIRSGRAAQRAADMVLSPEYTANRL